MDIEIDGARLDLFSRGATVLSGPKTTRQRHEQVLGQWPCLPRLTGHAWMHVSSDMLGGRSGISAQGQRFDLAGALGETGAQPVVHLALVLDGEAERSRQLVAPDPGSAALIEAPPRDRPAKM